MLVTLAHQMIQCSRKIGLCRKRKNSTQQGFHRLQNTNLSQRGRSEQKLEYKSQRVDFNYNQVDLTNKQQVESNKELAIFGDEGGVRACRSGLPDFKQRHQDGN